MKQKTAAILGGGGFIGSHLVKRLKEMGYWVRAVDLKYPEFSPSPADEFIIGDLRDPIVVDDVMLVPDSFDEVYQLAADMGGAGYIFTGDNDANVMHNSSLVNVNVAFYAAKHKVRKLFYSSSACIYPEHIQRTFDVSLREHDAVPAAPDSCYGWEKLFSEKLYDAFRRNYNTDTRIARFHNIFGEEGTWKGGREKYPAAICRKVAMAEDGGTINIWGDGKATRSFLYIDECIDGVIKLMASDYTSPINIGSDEMISVRDLAKMVIAISGKELSIEYDPGMPQGVRGRNSNNELIKEVLGWSPSRPLSEGMVKLYDWVNKQVHK